MTEPEELPDLEDWTGIEVVQIKASDNAKMHAQLRGLRKHLERAEDRIKAFIGIDAAGVRSFMQERERLLDDHSKMRRRLWVLELDLRTARETIVTQQVEILELKATLKEFEDNNT